MSWEEFRIGKTKKPDVLEFGRHLEDNLFALHHELKNKRYKHSDYTSFYITDPKVRHIHKALVKDRIVHHAIHRILYPIFDPAFIHDSYSCRIGKGTHRAVRRLGNFTRKVSKNYTGKCFVLKCDIRKFFASVDHEMLIELLEKKIKDEDLMRLIREIVGSFYLAIRESSLTSLGFPRERERERERGVPLGNLTSQLFANVYLNELDQFVKHDLRIKYYIRYCDDFVIVGDDEKDLEEICVKIKLFLEAKLRMELHPNKVEIRKLNQGIDFLGYVIKPHFSILRTKTKNRMLKRICEKNLSSYLELLSHCNGYGLEEKIKGIVDLQK